MDEQFTRVSKIVVKYYKEAPVELTESLFKEWIQALDEPMKSSFLKEGFEKAKTALPFLRFALELNDFGLRDYMRDHLGEKDFKYYLETFEKS